jgi:hypothetical protein
MVKRKSKPKKRVNRQKGVSVIGLAETYLLMNAATQTMFRTSPVQFLVGKPASGSATITLSELISPAGRFYNNPDIPGSGTAPRTTYIMRNIKAQWTTGLTQMVMIPLAFRLGKAVAKPAISRTNRLLAKGNIANTVKL